MKIFWIMSFDQIPKTMIVQRKITLLRYICETSCSNLKDKPINGFMLKRDHDVVSFSVYLLD
jgi:hypothetical protein